MLVAVLNSLAPAGLLLLFIPSALPISFHWGVERWSNKYISVLLFPKDAFSHYFWSITTLAFLLIYVFLVYIFVAWGCFCGIILPVPPHVSVIGSVRHIFTHYSVPNPSIVQIMSHWNQSAFAFSFPSATSGSVHGAESCRYTRKHTLTQLDTWDEDQKKKSSEKQYFWPSQQSAFVLGITGCRTNGLSVQLD